PEASLSGDELVPSISGSADHERLEDPDLSDGGGQGRDRLVVETRAGLLRIRRHGVDRYLHQPRGGLTGLGRTRDQRRQASTEPAAFRHHWPPLRNSRHRRFGAFPPSCNVSPMSLAGSTGGRPPRGTCTRGSGPVSISDPTSGSGADGLASGSSSADDISSAGFPPGSRVGAWTTTEGRSSNTGIGLSGRGRAATSWASWR